MRELQKGKIAKVSALGLLVGQVWVTAIAIAFATVAIRKQLPPVIVVSAFVVAAVFVLSLVTQILKVRQAHSSLIDLAPTSGRFLLLVLLVGAFVIMVLIYGVTR